MRWRHSRAVAAAGIILAAVAAIGLLVTASAGAAGVPIVVGGARPSMPSISGSQVVWADKYDGNWDLFRYDGITGTTSRLTSDAADQSMPSVSGSRVAYVDYSTGNGDIVVRDLVTGVSTRFTADGDQTNPSLSGDWLAWEDHSTRSARVRVRNLDTKVTYAVGADRAAAEHPRVEGDLLVWEDHGANADGRLDPDVQALVLSTNTRLAIATADVTEYYPDTNGRYIVWSESAGDGYRVRGYDVATGRYIDISAGEGEQTTPAITDDTVYWSHNTSGQPLHVDTYDLASGRRAPFYSYSSGDVVGLTASGENTAWLETAGSRLRVRVLFGDGLSPLSRLATFNPVSSIVSSVRLALISTAGDAIAPAVVSASVEAGESRVSPTDPIDVTFSEPLDPATVSSRTVRLLDATTGSTVPATVRYSALTNEVTLDPAATLGSGTFTLEVDPTLTDQAGNALTAPTELSFSTSNATEDLAKPTKPGLNSVIVSGTGNIQATWSASADDVGVAFYDVYRCVTPMSAMDYAGGVIVATVPSSTLTATFAKDPSETAKSYTYYYAVVARDTVDHTSTPSTNMAPNPHGTYSATASTSSCQRCHSVHGGALISPMLGARSAAACYECHGGTSATSAFGAASTMDSQGKFNDDSGIAGGGTGASGGTGNGGWSIHRTDDMSGSTFGRECDACHSPHRKSYDAVQAQSYGRLLRIYSTQGSTSSAPAYSTDAAPFGEKMCYECHGTGSMGVMDSFGGVGTYISAGGDHQAGYETTGVTGAAHNPANVRYTTRAARPNGGALPRIACLACHNEHASPVRSLVDYRGSDTVATTYEQSGLCFACHSSSATEGAQSTGTAPFAWNGRNVEGQFKVVGTDAGASRHPVMAGKGYVANKSGTVFSQDTKAEFDVNGLANYWQTLTNTADGNGSVVLATYIPTIDPPAESYLFEHDGGSQTFNQYRPADNLWNANNYGRFVPPVNGSFNTGSGSTLFSVAGKVYVTKPGSTTTPVIRQYTPPAGTGVGAWANTALTTAFNSQFNVGSQSTVNTGASAVYISAGGGSNIINWWNYPGTSENNMTFSGGNLGAGSGIAYAPTADRLFVLYRNGTTATGGSVGRLFWLAAPGVKTGAQTFTDGGTALQLTRSTNNTDYNRLVHFRDGAGVDYLMMVGLDTGGANDTVIVSTLGGTPVKTELNISPFAAALADGCDLKWDGVNGGYIYVTRGGTNATMSRIRIPASSAQTAGNWGTWSALTATPQNQDAGAGIAFAIADPPSYTGSTAVYRPTGTVRSSEIRVSAGTIQSWGTLTFARSLPSGATTAGVRVEGWNGSAWVGVATATVSPYDLSGIPVGTYQKLQLVGVLTTTDQAVTPRLDSWSVTANWTEWVSGTDIDTAWTSFNQSTKAEFDSNGAPNFDKTVSNLDDGDGSVVLGTYAGFDQVAEADFWFFGDAVARLDSLLPGATAWNGVFNPTDPTASPATGASAVQKNTYIFAMQGGGANTLLAYQPPANSGTGTWTATTNLWQTATTGSDMVLDTDHGFIWALIGGFTPSTTSPGTNIRRSDNFTGTSLVWNTTTGNYEGPAFQTGGTERRLGAGAALAWVPASGTRVEKLYVINRDGTDNNRDGDLWYMDNPDPHAGGVNWTDTNVNVGRNQSSTSDLGSRMVYFRIGSTDYLYAMRGAANLEYLFSIGNTTVAGALTALDNGTANPFNANIGDGCDIQWNGDTTPAGFRLLATRGGGSNVSAVATWNGTPLPVWTAGPALLDPAGAGSYLAYAKADPPPIATTVYYLTGTLTSNSITPTTTATKWGFLTYEAFAPSGQTTVAVTVQGSSNGGSTWTDLYYDPAVYPIDLTGHSTIANPLIRLVARLTTSDPGQTPRLDAWSVSSTYPRFQTSGSVTCVNCHNAHTVKVAGTSWWQLARVSDPDNINTTSTAPSFPTDMALFCLRCHDGSPPVATRSASVNIPYSVAFSAVDPAISPLFPGWNKSAANMAFTNSGHYTASTANGKALCQNCHDPHASDFASLIAWTKPTGVTWTGTAPADQYRANTDVTASWEENLCYRCHGSGASATGKAAGAANVFTPAGLTYKHPMAINAPSAGI
ncbi:MAG: cytochrome c3 family protein, partial [Coriobacteriia bacterium]|nr:cytochrome c3 family protein [Coriobacteriia bacterium]